MADAPLLLDRLTTEDAEHFAEVRALLDDAGLEYELDPTLVRGPRLLHAHGVRVREPRLGAQSGVGGGGRYDGLVEELGGPPTPGVGWAAGIERILLAARRTRQSPRSACSSRWPSPTAPRPPSSWRAGCAATASGWSSSRPGRSMKGQLKQADRIGARTTVIVGDGIDVKDMDSGEQREAAGPDEAIQMIHEALR